MNYRKNNELNELHQQAEILKQKTQDIFRRTAILHHQLEQETKKLELEQQAKSKSEGLRLSKETSLSSEGSTKSGGKFFAGGTRTPSTAELLEAFNNPSKQKELFAEVQFELDQQRASS